MNKNIAQLKQKIYNNFSGGEYVDVTEYASLSEIKESGKTIWTKAFYAAVRNNSRIYVPKGTYYIDDTIVIPSNRTIKADKNACICLTGDCKKVLLRNDSVTDCSNGSKKDAKFTCNVSICGGIWSTEFSERAEYGKLGAYDDDDSLHGVYATMLFSGVQNLWLQDMVFKNSAAFAVQIGRTHNFIIENIEFIKCFADGVHLNGDVKNGAVVNVRGETEDDLIALNAYDWDNSTINNGSMENITVDGVTCEGGECHCMRFAPGILPEEKGGVDCFMKNIRVANVKGVSLFKLYLQTPPYIEKPDGTMVGHVDEIEFENIEVVKDRPSDNTKDMYSKNPVTGHFGVFELGSNIDKLILKNISVMMNVDEYPDTAHFITAGPKSCYVKSKNLEIFDPYATSVCKEIKFSNVVIDGKKVEELKPYIKEISFSKLYPSSLPFGSGKVEKTVMI